MKQWLAACLLLYITSVCSAQGLALRDAFRQMPDSVMPTLTQNNRLEGRGQEPSGRHQCDDSSDTRQPLTAGESGPAGGYAPAHTGRAHRHGGSGDCSRGDLPRGFHLRRDHTPLFHPHLAIDSRSDRWIQFANDP